MTLSYHVKWLQSKENCERGTLCNDKKVSHKYVSTKHQRCKVCEANSAKLKEERDKHKYLEIWTLFFQKLIEHLHRKNQENYRTSTNRIYSTFIKHSTSKQQNIHTFQGSPRTCTKNASILGHEANLNEFKRIETT